MLSSLLVAYDLRSVSDARLFDAVHLMAPGWLSGLAALEPDWNLMVLARPEHAGVLSRWYDAVPRLTVAEDAGDRGVGLRIRPILDPEAVPEDGTPTLGILHDFHVPALAPLLAEPDGGARLVRFAALVSGCRRLLCLSKSVAPHVVGLNGRAQAPIDYIEAAFRPTPTDPAGLKGPYLACLPAPAERANLEILMMAVAQAFRRHPDTPLRVVIANLTDPAEARRVALAIERFGLSDRVSLDQNTAPEHLDAVIADCVALVCPEVDASFNVAAAMARAVGKPVLHGQAECWAILAGDAGVPFDGRRLDTLLSALDAFFASAAHTGGAKAGPFETDDDAMGLFLQRACHATLTTPPRSASSRGLTLSAIPLRSRLLNAARRLPWPTPLRALLRRGLNGFRRLVRN